MFLLAILTIAFCFSAASCQELIDSYQAKYEPTWDSLDKRPLPNWYDEAKVGIFIHWGVYSVPTMGSEWFWKYWKTDHRLEYVNYMRKNFRPGFTYQDFGTDFTTEHFDAKEWATLFAKSGAKYVVLTSKHHDGYALWPSKYSFGWNSVDVGSHRDLIGELAKAVRKTPLRFGLYHSLFEWFNPMWISDKASKFQKKEFVEKKIYPEMTDLINKYKPDIVWSDGEAEAPYKYWNATEFLAWLYNDSPVKDSVVTNDRWGEETQCKHGGFYTCGDRYNPGVLQDHKWENAMTIDRKSWGHRANAKLEDFLTPKDLIDEIVMTVSCGGNILINVGPTKSGIIEPIYADRLLEMGKWLKTNGDAIYDTVPWIHQNDTKTPGVWYTARAHEKDRDTVYAIILQYPYETEYIQLHSLHDLLDEQSNVRLLGYSNDLQWDSTADAVRIKLPGKEKTDKLGLNYAWTVSIDIARPRTIRFP